ncbi:hypothetical protein P7C71_g5266, partial [Lecanoromycetidae sp. Uapishka_2]
MPSPEVEASEGDRMEWNMHTDRKLLMFMAKEFLNRDMKIDFEAAAEKFGCTVRAVEERMKKIKKMAMVETAKESSLDLLPYGDRPGGHQNRYSVTTPAKATNKKTTTPAGRARKQAATSASRKGKAKATAEDDEDADETTNDTDNANVTDSTTNTTDSAIDPPRKKRKYRGEDGKDLIGMEIANKAAKAASSIFD